jgi:prepilin-type N-terminal cleavage/methylation domain-containing protein/prepilin-type processing-associated H-X9-DG protein
MKLSDSRSKHAACCRAAFTLVELLVVIAIIGILVALLLPAIQAAREAARRTQCKDNVKNISLGCLLHEDAHGFLPSGGWGRFWTGDPNRGYGAEQPGSWIYNVLTFVEETTLRNLGSGQAISSAGFREASEKLHQTPVPIFQCPSRRASRLYLAAWLTVREQTWIANLAQTQGVPKSDYAANSGDSQRHDTVGMIEPASYAAAATADWTPTIYCDPRARTDPARSNFQFCQTGVMYYRSGLKFAQITDGTSSTYLVGEKYLDPNAYDCTIITGLGCTGGDQQSMYTGFEWDNHRVAWNPYVGVSREFYQPRQDTPGADYVQPFGSAHPGGLNMAFCDGSVQTISYDIDSDAHRWLANRSDGEVATAGGGP